MSAEDRCYLGPFGRYLPLPESVPTIERPSSTGRQLTHSGYQLPAPNVPHQQLGNDPMLLHAGDGRSNSSSKLGSMRETERHSKQESLPSVSHLLTPTLQSGASLPPFSSPNRQGSPPIGRSLYSPPNREPYDRISLYPTPGRQQYAASLPPYHTQSSSQVPTSQALSQGVQSYSPPSSASPWPATEAHQSFEDNPITRYAQQTVPYHQSQLPYQAVVSNGVSRSSSFHNQAEFNSGRSGGQRIPRVIGEEHIPGEGLCYIYDDGSHCRKTIDGEIVNANWGVTKAGKPRKRLAQACITCREKKIKCDPSTPKCVQCQKFGRECRFESAPRGHQAASYSAQYKDRSARTSEAKTGPNSSSSGIGLEIYQHGNADGGRSRSNGSLEHLLHPSSPRPSSRGAGPTSSYEENGQKRRRTGSGSLFEGTMPSKDKEHPRKLDFESAIMRLEGATTAADPVIQYQKDPYSIEPEVTTQYLELYFTHINQATYCMFPEKPFFGWLIGSTTKSAQEVMLLYSMLAVGSLFATPQNKSDTKLLFDIARYAAEKNHGNFTLQLVQSRLVLALGHFTMGEPKKAWDYCGSALRAANALRLNTESGANGITGDQVCDYGLTREASAECQRRTFWSAYIMDRFNTFAAGHLSVFDNRDVFLRLPCPEHLYNNNQASETPFFADVTLDSNLALSHTQSPIGSMGYNALMSCIWGDVLQNAYRMKFERSDAYASEYETFSEDIQSRIRAWTENLPQHLVYSESNLDLSIRQGYIGSFISLHTLRLTALMKLNRHVRHDLVPMSSLHRNIQAGRHHALELMKIVSLLSKIGRQNRLPTTVVEDFVFCTPFTGYSILTAIDILTSAGLVRTLPEDLLFYQNCLSVVEELTAYFASARGQSKTIGKRLEDISSMANSQVGYAAYRTKRPMESTLGIENDVFYTVDDATMFDAMELSGVIGDQKVATVDPTDT